MHTLRMLSIFKSHIRVTLRDVNVNTRVIPLRMRLCVQAGILDRIRDITQYKYMSVISLKEHFPNVFLKMVEGKE